MKTLRKLALVLFSLMLCVSLFALPGMAFAQSGDFVFDEQSLFSDSEFQTLESKAKELAEKYNMGVYLWTTDAMNETAQSDEAEEKQRKAVTENFYRGHNLGLGENHDGIILVIASVSREYNVGGLGQGSYSFSDKGIALMKDAIAVELKKGDWYAASMVYYNQADDQLSYYSQKGKPYTPLSLSDYVLRLFIVLGIPLIITMFIINGWRRDMKTAVEQTEASNYLDSSSVQVTQANDRFIRTAVIATPRPKSQSSGGGGWGGGGGGGFSSSGGRF